MRVYDGQRGKATLTCGLWMWLHWCNQQSRLDIGSLSVLSVRYGFTLKRMQMSPNLCLHVNSMGLFWTGAASTDVKCSLVHCFQEIAPDWHCARGSTSTLAKLLDWHFKGVWQKVTVPALPSARVSLGFPAFALAYPVWLLCIAQRTRLAWSSYDSSVLYLSPIYDWQFQGSLAMVTVMQPCCQSCCSLFALLVDSRQQHMNVVTADSSTCMLLIASCLCALLSHCLNTSAFKPEPQ